MFTKLIVICLTVSISRSYGIFFFEEHDKQSGENQQQELIIQFENKMKTLFSIWKTETNRKLDTLEQMIPDLEENINRKLYSLRNSILDKLEEYIDGKLNNLERSIPEKFNQNMNCNMDLLDKKTFETFEKNINFKFDVLARNISIFKSDTLKKVTDFEENVNRKLDFLGKRIPTNFYENIDSKLDIMVKNISKELEENINCKLDDLKNTTDLQDNINQYVSKNLTYFENNKTSEFDVNDSSNANNSSNAPTIVDKTSDKRQLPCKEETLSSYDKTSPYSLDNATLNHVIVKGAGIRLNYFEMHFAIKADAYVIIFLKDRVDDSNIRFYINVGYNSNQYTKMDYQSITYQKVHTPDILSSTEFRTFYIKIENDVLEFGKDGDSSPLFSNYDSNLVSVNYFSFYYYGESIAEIRYDCPPVPGSS